VITPAQARALADKPWFERQIEREATGGRHCTILEGNHASLSAARFVLVSEGYDCDEVKRLNNAQAFTMPVSWKE
jgi:hypothetical protein